MPETQEETMGEWNTHRYGYNPTPDAKSAQPEQLEEPHCDYCGLLGWTVEKYGLVTHKEACPHRADPWSQSHIEPLVPALATALSEAERERMHETGQLQVALDVERHSNTLLDTALSECQERERVLREAAEDVLDYASTPRRSALSKLRSALAAQPPSEASEGKP
jgi:hypothetical protein